MDREFYYWPFYYHAPPYSRTQAAYLNNMQEMQQQQQEELILAQQQEELILAQQQEEQLRSLQSQGNLGTKTIDYGRLTSFLEVDDTFLTTWNRKPDSLNKDGPKTVGTNRRMNIEQGSFFSSFDGFKSSK